jgi:predicted ATPase
MLELEISNNSKEVKALISTAGLLRLNDNGEIVDTENSNDKFNLSSETISSLGFNVDYIGGIRVEPENNYYINNDFLKKIGVKGQNTYPVLIQDFKKSKQLVNKISEWYKNNFEGWKIGVIENKLTTETNYSVVISTEKIDSINIKQSGQGIHQVLPLIARSFMPEQSPSIIIIEEPEAHLHPAAHANLAERFLDSYLEDQNKRYLIETHSQNFILRIRRLIAEGKLNAEDLNIYYVDYDEDSNVSKLQEIKVDAGGGVDRWPDGVFGESVLEARAIMNANINDLKNVD